ncbi:hypothetical protein COCSADRAFT_263942 [Bipolaris sorokiniana ND90Pr]|uniref:Uncharacterized protein n=1 Tax=Cochliobolus sativus (strain ND90Pr / ATCC 201652) TaxID=665912 RepID=M2SN52_COCSN|nr:uncharacterized protein COCSADRAFT_263942 [Bipolaris sorokiniana ND90Pr]EMD58566.1 hypothetical protein COCSADRAFT_263942 [Bipolaris sorokiniana ND90Pr]
MWLERSCSFLRWFFVFQSLGYPTLIFPPSLSRFLFVCFARENDNSHDVNGYESLYFLVFLVRSGDMRGLTFALTWRGAGALRASGMDKGVLYI